MKGECILRTGEGGAIGGDSFKEDARSKHIPARTRLSLLSDEVLVSIALGESVDGMPAGEPVRARDRDAALNALTERHYRSVRKVVKAAMGRSPDVDDVLQSAFLSAYRSLASLKDRSRFMYWLRIIAVNEARDMMKGQVHADDLDVLLTLPEASQDRIPAQAAEASWLIEELNNRLPKQYMKVLYLRYYLDYTVNEVAGMLGIPPGLVKWRANRARRLARMALSDNDAVSKGSGKERKGKERRPSDGQAQASQGPAQGHQEYCAPGNLRRDVQRDGTSVHRNVPEMHRPPEDHPRV